MKPFFEINSEEFVDAACQVIEELDSPFNSHDFIKKFAKANEEIYIKWLYDVSQKEDRTQGVFQTVHTQIGKRLSDCSTSNVLPITKIGTVPDPNVFGLLDNIAEWEKL